MDNEASKSLKGYIIRNHNSQYQLAELHNHCLNAAERSIQSFKDYFFQGCAPLIRNPLLACGMPYWDKPWIH